MTCFGRDPPLADMSMPGSIFAGALGDAGFSGAGHSGRAFELTRTARAAGAGVWLGRNADATAVGIVTLGSAMG